MKMMMLTMFSIYSLLGMMACKTSSKNTTAQGAGDNSMTSLDWDGTYYGILPCADCAGIETVVALNKNLTYTVKRKYMGKGDSINISSGSFTWAKDGGSVSLGNESPSKYKVGENKIIQLDMNGNQITGNLSDKYILTKQTTGITEKYWKLVELNGKQVAKTESMKREPFMILKAQGNRVNGNGGCNSFGGTYTLLENGKIKFSQMAGTLMACPDMAVETEFMKVLETADNYTINGDRLSLNKARMAPLARFEAVYFK